LRLPCATSLSGLATSGYTNRGRLQIIYDVFVKPNGTAGLEV
jgi:hypothetical protein